MKFTQNIIVSAPIEEVWQVVRDIPNAASCIPGAQEVRAADGGRYEGKIRVRVGPIAIELEGAVALKTENAITRHLVMDVEGSARRVGGGVTGSMELQLKELDQNQTELWVTADLVFLGRLGELGQPLVRKKAEDLLKEFAKNLSESTQA